MGVPKNVVWEKEPKAGLKSHGYRALGSDYARKGVEHVSLCGLSQRPVVATLSFDVSHRKCRCCINLSKSRK